MIIRRGRNSNWSFPRRDREEFVTWPQNGGQGPWRRRGAHSSQDARTPSAKKRNRIAVRQGQARIRQQQRAQKDGVTKGRLKTVTARGSQPKQHKSMPNNKVRELLLAGGNTKNTNHLVGQLSSLVLSVLRWNPLGGGSYSASPEISTLSPRL